MTDATKYFSSMAGSIAGPYYERWKRAQAPPAEPVRRYRYNIVFEADIATYYEVFGTLMRHGVGNLVTVSNADGNRRKFGFDTTFEDWRAIVASLEGLGLAERDLNAKQYEMGGGGRLDEG